jgi:hypothetical protein
MWDTNGILMGYTYVGNLWINHIRSGIYWDNHWDIFLKMRSKHGFQRSKTCCSLFSFPWTGEEGTSQKIIRIKSPIPLRLELSMKSWLFRLDMSKNFPGSEVHWALLSKSPPFQPQTWRQQKLLAVVPHGGTCFNSSIFSMRPPSPFTKILALSDWRIREMVSNKSS